MKELKEKILGELINKYDYTDMNIKFEKSQLKSVFHQIVSDINYKFGEIQKVYEEKEEELSAQVSNAKSKLNRVFDKICELKDRIKNRKDDKNKIRTTTEALQEEYEDERKKTKDSYRLPKSTFITFAIIAGIGECISYFHMFKSQEYIIKELSGETYTGAMTLDGYLYYLLPIFLAAALTITIIFLSKQAGKVLRHLQHINKECYEKRNNEVRNRSLLSTELTQLTKEGAVENSEKINKLNELIDASYNKTSWKLSLNEFISNLFSKEVLLYVVGSTIFVFTIAYGATELRESALKQQYDAANLSSKQLETIDALSSGDSGEGHKDENEEEDMEMAGDLSGADKEDESDKSENETESIVESDGFIAKKEKTLAHIENIYNSRAEGSIWFLFINSLLYLAGMILGYFSHTSNRDLESKENDLDKKVKAVNHLDKDIAKLQKQLTEYVSSSNTEKVKNEYFHLLKELDQIESKVIQEANELKELTTATYNDFIDFCKANAMTEGFTIEEAQNEFTILLENYKKDTQGKKNLLHYASKKVENHIDANWYDRELNKHEMKRS
jgi:uncharacterized protein YoxC